MRDLFPIAGTGGVVPDGAGIVGSNVGPGGSAYDKVLRRTVEVTAGIEARFEAQKPQQLFLPGMDEFMRSMPNHLARSSLYAPVALGRKTVHKGTVLISRSDAVIKFWGEQLDEAQADVWMQAIYVASKVPLGEPVAIERADFLKKLGRSTGKAQYLWLHRSMIALTVATLVMEVQTKGGTPKLSIGKTRALHMIDGFNFDDEAEVYKLRIDSRWHAMYRSKEYALIDWGKRLQIGRGQSMAKALQRLIATSSDVVQRYTLDWLKPKMAYTSPLRKFRAALDAATDELERVEIIAHSRIELNTKGKEQLTIWLPPSV